MNNPKNQTNLIGDQGATLSRVFVCKDATGAAIDLTGASAEFFAHLGDYAGPKIINLDSGSLGGVTVDGTAGTIAFEVSAAAMAALPIGGAPTATGTEIQADSSVRTATGASCSWSLLVAFAGGVTVLAHSGTLVITRR